MFRKTVIIISNKEFQIYRNYGMSYETPKLSEYQTKLMLTYLRLFKIREWKAEVFLSNFKCEYDITFM